MPGCQRKAALRGEPGWSGLPPARERCYESVMRLAALDVGDARIGLAVCDELGLTVRGIGVVRRVGGRRDLDEIASCLAPYQPARIVVGLPLNMDGSEGPQAARVRAFAERLGTHLGLAIELWDERLTTVEAEHTLRSAGVPRQRRRDLVDQEAAAIILESYLARPT
jgi:putative Holliday junction resolvase